MKSSLEGDSDHESERSDQNFSPGLAQIDEHPERNTFEIDGMKISSDFDSGNLKDCVKNEEGRVSLF